MAYKISINVLLSLGLVLTPFIIGTPFSSLGWFFLGISNKKPSWIIGGLACLFCSIYFIFYLVYLLVKGSMVAFVQKIFRSDASFLFQSSQNNPLFFFALVFLVLQFFNMIVFFMEFPSNTALSSIIMLF